MTNQDQDSFYRSICELQSQALEDISYSRPISDSLSFVTVWLEKVGLGRFFTAIHYINGDPDNLSLATVTSVEKANGFAFETVDLRQSGPYTSIRKTKSPLFENNKKIQSFYSKRSNLKETVQEKVYWPIIAGEDFLGAITLFYRTGHNSDENDIQILQEVNGIVAALIQAPGNKAKELTAYDILKKSVKQAPVLMGLLRGPEMVIEWYNDILEPVWGKGRNVVGMRLIEAQPELKNETFFLDQLVDVYNTGEPFQGTEVLSRIYIDGKLEDKYFDYVYHPVKNSNGITEAVLVIAPDVTERVKGKRSIQAQEFMFKEVVMMAPFIILILRGPEMIVEIGNAPLFAYWNKTQEAVIGKPLLKVLPELENQPFVGILRRIYDTGESFGEREVLNFFETPEGRVNKYVSYLYQPLKDYDGEVNGIMVTAEDVTKEVISRQEIILGEERLRLANAAARLGTFDLDLKSGTLLWDKRCRELFGISHQNPVTYEKDFMLGLHPEDQERVSKLIESVYNRENTNGEYDTEYRTVSTENGKTRWIRARGKTFFDENDKPYRFVGVVIDITENKLDELRKNDFIAMVSHELKTPLTSLKSYIQMALMEAKKGEVHNVAKFMDRANVQTGKMATMINAFLDLSRLESGHMPFKPERFHIQPLITETISDIQSIYACNIVMEKCEQIEIVADREKISHVMLNLLSNAIKYSPKMSEIRVKCWFENGYVKVAVIDKGNGVEEKYIPHLFERFFRIKNNNYDTTSGFGIGLYLVAEIIKMHQGTIDVTSKIGQGSTFSFSLPL